MMRVYPYNINKNIMQKTGDDDDFIPSKQPIRNKYKKDKTWTQAENLLYIAFLKDCPEDFSLYVGPKRTEFLQKMSKFIKTRTVKQCRSHDQKMFIKYKTLQKMVKLIQNKSDTLPKKEEDTQQGAQYKYYNPSPTKFEEKAQNSHPFFQNYYFPYGVWPMPLQMPLHVPLQIPMQFNQSSTQILKEEHSVKIENDN